MRMTLHFDTETEGDEDRYVQAVAADELAVALRLVRDDLSRRAKYTESVERYEAIREAFEAFNSIMDDYPLAQNAVESLD